MLDFLFCVNNLTCHFDTLKEQLSGPKYPSDVAEICYYFENQKVELPEYCKWKSQSNPPRRRNEF